MPFYVALYKLTDQGAKTIKDSPKRARTAIKSIEKAGVKVHHLLYTTGRYDLIVVAEAPNDRTMLAATLAITSAGNVTGETLHAFTVDQMAKIVSNIP